MTDPRRQTWTIPTTDSDGISEDYIDMQFLHLCGIDVPQMTTDTTAIGFVACKTSDGTYLPVYKSDGTRLTLFASDAAAVRTQTEPGLFAGLRYVKIQALDTDGDALQQTTSDREITPSIRNFG